MTEENQDKKVSKMHRWLFEPGADGDQPMAERIARMVKSYEDGEVFWRWSAAIWKWASRVFFVLLTALGISSIPALVNLIKHWWNP